jgi:SNF2 family DNA or RNA helicase
MKKAEKDYQQYANNLEDFIGGDSFGELAELRHETGLLKVPVISKHIIDTLTADVTLKTLVFAHHHDVVDKYMEKFGELAVAYTGRENEAQKQAAEDAFMTNPAIRVMVGSIRSAGVGLNLTVANLVVFAELDPVPGWLNQGADRAHRIGQEKAVNVQHFAYEGTIDNKLTKLLVSKAKTTDRVINNPIK